MFGLADAYAMLVSIRPHTDTTRLQHRREITDISQGSAVTEV